MLEFATKVKGKGAVFGMAAEAGVAVESGLVRTSVVVDQGLAEMKAVAQWSSRYAAKIRIDTFQSRARVAGWIQFGLELVFLAQRKSPVPLHCCCRSRWRHGFLPACSQCSGESTDVDRDRRHRDNRGREGGQEPDTPNYRWGHRRSRAHWREPTDHRRPGLRKWEPEPGRG